MLREKAPRERELEKERKVATRWEKIGLCSPERREEEKEAVLLVGVLERMRVPVGCFFLSFSYFFSL